ncbi:F0F1 ATP synthase subunit A [Nocardioides sp. ChNu-153]|uniref:F0F1 ATP synthase subunit A n=1 Tax=unclassified Nocardioides TaxID=2615069 RepID=UPI0024062B2F|nr:MULTISPECIES: F0F1 ATP synthase subunit A [unclassified Nocardioides]MDF9715471.1 F0F1 ATP synthase subunit A [Nocardioides sp. ChNu-99]MDN7120634.1 F0F1 ATP synthase subunit A [Nocardioides sp. ChNu-153]
MSAVVLAASGDEFTPPGPADFDLPPIGGGSSFEFLGQEMTLGVTKPMLQIVIFAGLVFAFLYLASRKRAMVPGKLQYVGESAYGFVRNSLGRDIIGSHDFQRFTPYLVSLFFLVLFNNWAASIPFVQFPTFSRAGLVYGLAAVSWIVYNYVGIRKHGFLGYLKLQVLPSGVTGPILILIVPLEFFSNLIVRPVTLALRLLCNMFAGHLLLILFALGGEYLLLHGAGLVKPVGILAWVLFAAVFFLELLIQFLQAYVFTLLTAMYIAGALADEH